MIEKHTLKCMLHFPLPPTSVRVCAHRYDIHSYVVRCTVYVRDANSQLELYGAHTPCSASQLHAAIDSCLYVLSMNTLQEEKGSAVVYSDFAAIVCILFIAYS